MSDAFFQYIHNNRTTNARNLYVFESDEKVYFRQQYTALPHPQLPTVSLITALQNRKSCSSFDRTPVSIQEVSNLLAVSLAKDIKNQGSKGYSFPSGGGFFPIETYLLIKNVKDLASGLYHYKSTNHSITFLDTFENGGDEVCNDFLPELAVQPAIFILMTMVKSRTMQKYGTLSYYLSLVESGHRGQNIYLAAAALGLGCRAFGYNDYDKLNQLLGVDGANEHYIYGLGIGSQADV